ncbi:MAG: amidohydrolase family protein [Pirellulales bacterium]
MIVDAHTHWWTQPGASEPDASGWLARARGYGITHAVVLPTLGLLHDGCLRHDHDTLAAVAGQSNGLMLPFCTAQPWQPDEALSEIERCLRDLHFRGIKFHPWLQGASVSSAAMDDICALASQYEVPILFHDGTPPFSLPAQVGLLARRHARVNIILGHCGMLEHWREAIAVLQAVPNLWGCLCSPTAAAMLTLLHRCDPNRLLWGSDVGFGEVDTYPYRLGLMHELGVDPARIDTVLETNPRRLFKLS